MSCPQSTVCRYLQEGLCSHLSLFKALPHGENIAEFSSTTNTGFCISERSLDMLSLDILRVKKEKWGFSVDWKTLPREFWIMLHCNDGEFYLGPWPFEHFYHRLDKGDGFIKFATGMLPGGLWLKLDDKIRISPAPVRQEWWVKIQ